MLSLESFIKKAKQGIPGAPGRKAARKIESHARWCYFYRTHLAVKEGFQPPLHGSKAANRVCLATTLVCWNILLHHLLQKFDRTCPLTPLPREKGILRDLVQMNMHTPERSNV